MLPYAYAQAADGMMPRITLGEGLDSMRQVDFTIPGKLPQVISEAKIVKYHRSLDTPEKIITFAQKMGLSNIDKNNEISPANMTTFEDKEARLTIYPQGTWFYELTGPRSSAGSDTETARNPESIARQWLQQRELLPEEPYTFTKKNNEPGSLEFMVELPQGPDGKPLIGFTPQISVTVNGGQVTGARGVWYTPREEWTAPLTDFNTALKALQRGEGVFTGSQTRYAVPGQAVVEKAQLAYQLSYGLDYTPYLIPVAVFTGSFTPQGGAKESFTAYVSLLKCTQQKNAGNFKLETSLPVLVSNIFNINEKKPEETASELPVVARFFGLKDQPGPEGEYTGPEGRLFLTSWDSGWLYRSSQMGQSRQDMNLSDERILQAADAVAKKLPLPGKLGEPYLIGAKSDGFIWVSYPLLYNGIPVMGNEDLAYISRLSIQVGSDGELWSVNCAQPMKSSGKRQKLLSPQEAWQELQANHAQVHVDGFFGRLAGDKFQADQSNVTEVKLVYVPQHPEMARNQNYEIKYSFKGTAMIGGNKIRFNAFVDAVK